MQKILLDCRPAFSSIHRISSIDFFRSVQIFHFHHYLSLSKSDEKTGLTGRKTERSKNGSRRTALDRIPSLETMTNAANPAFGQSCIARSGFPLLRSELQGFFHFFSAMFLSGHDRTETRHKKNGRSSVRSLPFTEQRQMPWHIRELTGRLSHTRDHPSMGMEHRLPLRPPVDLLPAKAASYHG